MMVFLSEERIFGICKPINQNKAEVVSNKKIKKK
jgi:hypothetical protein